MSVNNFETIYYDLFKQHYSALLFYAARLVGEDDAEDIVQDVFVELWNNKSKIDFDDHIKSFLYRSVYTRSINFLKHKSVVDRMFELSHGYKRKGNTHFYVSSDLSLWEPPFRIGTQSEMIVFNITFSQADKG
jgi:DNA-directed RNA polymerase specialized sigma24 family protein